jgi:hypothetical protein
MKQKQRAAGNLLSIAVTRIRSGLNAGFVRAQCNTPGKPASFVVIDPAPPVTTTKIGGQ